MQAKRSACCVRGQVATEFFLYTAVFMIVAIAAFVVIDQTQRSEIPVRENTIAQETGRFFQSSIEMSIRAGEGFTYNYTFPRTVLGNPYNLTFSKQNNLMVLDWRGSYGAYSQAYDLPTYTYIFAGIKPDSDPYVFESTSGGSSLTLFNDGATLTITHGDS